MSGGEGCGGNGGGGYCSQRQEESKTVMRYRLTDCLSRELWVHPTAPCR